MPRLAVRSADAEGPRAAATSLSPSFPRFADHPNGTGRDGFISATSEHQTNFTYVPKAPEFVGTRMPGMASNMVGLTSKPGSFPMPAQVTGYTGLRGPSGEPPTAADAFPNLGPAPKTMVSSIKSFEASKAAMSAHHSNPNYRIPGYAGHSPGHQQVCGWATGPINWGDAGKTTYAAIGFDAPGLNAGEQVIKNTNLAPGAVIPAGLPRTKAGYTGHLPGRHFSSNFGKAFMYSSEELLATEGQPPAGGIPDPGQPFNADVESKLVFPAGHIDRPQRLKTCVVGYAGFRPRTTPGVGAF